MSTATDVTSKGKPDLEAQIATDIAIKEALDGVAWMGKSLVVGDRVRIEGQRGDDVPYIPSIRRKNLSASTHQNVSGCAARFALESMLPRTMSPTSPAELGDAAHNVLEHFYDLPPEKRTLTALRRLVKPTVRKKLKPFEGTPEYDDLFAEITKTVGGWVEKIFELENPSEVNVFKTEQEFKGIRLSNGVPFVGYLDRTRYEGDRNDMDGLKLFIDDYKFGAKVKRPSPMFGDAYGDQMRLYKDAVYVEYGKVVESATLVWPRQGKLVPADLSAGAVKATLASFRRSWDLMNSAADAAVFPAVPSNLCGWCVAANICPVATVKSDNAKSNASHLPGGTAPDAPVALPIPTIREFAAPPRHSSEDAPRMEGATEEYAIPPHFQENIVTTTDFVAAATDKALVGMPNNKWGFIAATGLVDAAATHLSIYGQAFNRDTAPAFVQILGTIVEQVHRRVFAGGFDWSFDSASRVVYSVKESLRNYPAPFGADEAAWNGWFAKVAGSTAIKLRLAIALTDESDFGQPDFTAIAAATTLPEHSRNEDVQALLAAQEPALV